MDVALELVFGVFDTALLAIVDLADTLHRAWPRGDLAWADAAYERGRSDVEVNLPELRRLVRAFLEGLAAER